MKENWLGWILDGKEKSIRLEENKVKEIVQTINQMLHRKQGTQFKEFQKLMGKLHHAAMGVPAGQGFMTPLYKLLAKEPSTVWFRKNSTARQLLHLWKQLLLGAMKSPTLAKELVPSLVEYLGLVDTLSHGACGVWLSGTKRIKPTVW